MSGWGKFSSSFASLNIGQKAGSLAKGLNSSVQATKERFGQVNADDITELPQEYKDLEARVDALRQAHIEFLKIAKVYENESYDYPTQIQESLTEFGSSLSHNITTFAATNLKGTSLPTPTPSAAPQSVHKTLPHALARASATASKNVGEDDKLGRALHLYSGAFEKISDARLTSQADIRTGFLQPWQVTLNSSIAAAMKARAAVRVSRLELDGCKASLKGASAAKEEQARLEVENAEDDLVQKTEVAIGLMKTVLENPEPLLNLNALAKAQLVYFAQAAEVLSSVQGDIEELAAAAEGHYRKSRDH